MEVNIQLRDEDAERIVLGTIILLFFNAMRLKK